MCKIRNPIWSFQSRCLSFHQTVANFWPLKLILFKNLQSSHFCGNGLVMMISVSSSDFRPFADGFSKLLVVVIWLKKSIKL